MSALSPCRSDLFCPQIPPANSSTNLRWEIFKKRIIEITQVALKGLVPFIAGLICIALIPPIVNAFILPVVVVGLTFLMAFYGIMEVKPPKKNLNIFPADDSFFPLPQIRWDYSFSARRPPVDAPPRGIVRPPGFNNCWLNMVVQMLRRDSLVCEWLRNPTEERPLEDLAALGLFMRSYDQAIFSNQNRLDDHNISLVRRALAKLSAQELSPHFSRQEDIASGLDVIMGHKNLPAPRNTTLIERHYYREESGYPSLLEKEPRVQKTLNWGRIELPLAVSNECQSIQNLLPHFFEDINQNVNPEEDADRYLMLKAGDGTEYPYIEDRCIRCFERPPEKLWIQVKRFTYDPLAQKGHKNSSPVHVDEEIQIPTEEGMKTYELDSFAIHDGSSLSSGHYYGYIGNYYCNDGIVTLKGPEEKQLDSRQAYLLLYSLR
jgi:hypothetical protein